jgi:PIN domain nuclease of toxin-antitoxin system
MPLRDIVQYQQNKNRMQLLSVLLPHVLALASLPLHHKDPFDRILIAQAQVEQLTLMSHDSAFAQYPIQVVW